MTSLDLEKPLVNIEVKQSIEINADAKTVYQHFVNRPFKFASNKLLETKPFLAARTVITIPQLITKSRKELEGIYVDLEIGKKVGPFKFRAIKPGSKVIVGITTFFADLELSFVFTGLDSGRSELSLVDNYRATTFTKRLFLPLVLGFLPVHYMMAKTMLKVYKKEIESKN